MSEAAENLATARRYLKAIEDGAIGEVLAQFAAPEVVFETFPNRFLAQGARRDLAESRAAAERGKKAMSKQTYEITNAVASGDWVALEVRWVGTLAIPFETIPAGGQMRANFAAFLQFRNGRIIAQHNYDCYEPW